MRANFWKIALKVYFLLTRRKIASASGSKIDFHASKLSLCAQLFDFLPVPPQSRRVLHSLAVLMRFSRHKSWGGACRRHGRSMQEKIHSPLHPHASVSCFKGCFMRTRRVATFLSRQKRASCRTTRFIIEFLDQMRDQPLHIRRGNSIACREIICSMKYPEEPRVCVWNRVNYAVLNESI